MTRKLIAMLLALGAGLAPTLCAAANRVPYYDPTDPASPRKEANCTPITSTTTTRPNPAR